ncbi:unnamed protein product [Vitrella brassicaformis CCMP3155]|uniref:Uncharacterized protein n=1 Tax=Vitrella brassicaformis (strain CCMP3155) TaxID=1169540 RepID=A0A0G4H7S6_VITBC|nr:unnamed protein product [Vitrella brassicaformis CCMP3155]|eukprot:CEM39969.1 unnamed protein product [Vitrella brassicaformis CCMP3155]
MIEDANTASFTRARAAVSALLFGSDVPISHPSQVTSRRAAICTQRTHRRSRRSTSSAEWASWSSATTSSIPTSRKFFSLHRAAFAAALERGVDFRPLANAEYAKHFGGNAGSPPFPETLMPQEENVLFIPQWFG